MQINKINYIKIKSFNTIKIAINKIKYRPKI